MVLRSRWQVAGLSCVAGLAGRARNTGGARVAVPRGRRLCERAGYTVYTGRIVTAGYTVETGYTVDADHIAGAERTARIGSIADTLVEGAFWCR
jgi:hypothetical protein